jgi:hypothetical protein
MIVETPTTAKGLVSRHRAILTARLEAQADTYTHTAEILSEIGDHDELARKFRTRAARLSKPIGETR